MMPSDFSPIDFSPSEEMRSLVDQLYDGQLDGAGLERLETLLLADQTCLQVYVEQLDFHSELVDQADQTPPETAAITSMQRFSQASAARESRIHLRLNVLMVASVLCVVLGVGWMFSSVVFVAPEAGTIISLSTHVQSAAPLELGQVIRRGEQLNITRGVVSLQLPDVIVDIVAPAELRVDQSQRLYLLHGTVVAKVDAAGKGFTVSTPDAEVIDLGTEFLVEHDPRRGTYVSVRRGEAQAKLLGWRGVVTKMVELTASRAAEIRSSSETVREIAYNPDQYEPVDHSRAGIRRISGALRTIEDLPDSLKSNDLTTPNHMLVIPEQQGVVLENNLTVESLTGPVSLPQGTAVSSYLIHYDPTEKVLFAPRGSMTFSGEILALIGTSSSLSETDPIFGLPQIAMEPARFRELELDEDEIQISDDKRTLAFFFGVSPPEYLDQVRVLVKE